MNRMLDQMLTAHEYMAVVETIEEEIAACRRLDDYSSSRGPLLESAMHKLAPERDEVEDDSTGDSVTKHTHSLFMGDGHPDDTNEWDHGLSTDELIERVTTQLRDGEHDGDELTIVVRTRQLDQETS